MAELEEIGHPIHRTMGHPCFLEGEPGDFALLIKKGNVKVTSASAGLPCPGNRRARHD